MKVENLLFCLSIGALVLYSTRSKASANIGLVPIADYSKKDSQELQRVLRDSFKNWYSDEKTKLKLISDYQHKRELYFEFETNELRNEVQNLEKSVEYLHERFLRDFENTASLYKINISVLMEAYDEFVLVENRKAK